jgi:enoyl-CoA hydratase
VSDDIVVDVAGQVRVVRLNRPQVHNALTETMRQRLVALAADFDADDAVRAVVLTGTDPSFCAGVDVTELTSSPPARPPTNPASALREARTPWLAAVNGACMTGGLELALSCDFIVSSEQAFFGDNHARYGMTPSWGLTAMLPEAVGVRRAKEMSLSGHRLRAEEAVHLGLANHVLPHDELMPFVIGLARDIASADAESSAATLLLYDEVLRSRQEAGLRTEAIYKQGKKTNLAKVPGLWDDRART